jgi:hypothetical protein
VVGDVTRLPPARLGTFDFFLDIGCHQVAKRAVKDSIMVRLGPDGADRVLDRPHVRQMDFTGRPMKGMVFVQAAAMYGPALGQWVDAAAYYARGLPPKQATPPARKRL